MRIAIIGGGLTGLTLCYQLKHQGIRSIVLEKENECGGLLKTMQDNGFTFDCGGSHIIFSRDKEVLDYILALLGRNKVKLKRDTRILYKGRYIKYPFENDLASLPKEDNYDCLCSFVRTLIARERGLLEKPRNLAEWCCYTFGNGIASRYLVPYNEKIWKYPSVKTNLCWVDRIPNPPVEDIIKSSLGIKTEGYTHQLNFSYPRIGGIQSLANQIRKKLGDCVTTDFRVQEIRRENSKWIVKNGREERIYDKIISTIPIQDLVNSMDVPKAVQRACENLKYNSLISVLIGLNISRINKLSWLYIPDKCILTHRVSFPSNYSPYVAPTNKSSVLAEITCPVGGKIWRMKDEAIAKQVIDGLHSLKVIDEKYVCFSKVARMDYAYVIDSLDRFENMRIIKTYMNRLRIDLLGRFSEFEYMNMDACIRRAIDYSLKMNLDEN
jgi:protoporphyrinogen oxidase